MASTTPRPPEEEGSSSERRGNPRRTTFTVFTIRVSEDTVMGTGKDVSETGAYFVTGDDLRAEVAFEIDGKEVRRPGRVMRVDSISAGTLGVAVRFDSPLTADELPE